MAATGYNAVGAGTFGTDRLSITSDQAADGIIVNTDKCVIPADSGNITTKGALDVTGTSALKGTVTIGGGYGSTGITLSDAGVVQANGAATFDGAVTSSGNLTVGASKATVTAASGNISSAGSILSTSATAGIGYGTGAGGTVTQGTSRTTGVTVNKASGEIVLFSVANSSTPATFTVTNSAVAVTDTVAVCQKSGTDPLGVAVTNVAAGSFKVTVWALSGTTVEAPKLSFAVIKGVAA